MSWKSTMRAIQAEQRRQAREEKRRQRELERRRKEYEKMQEIEKAAYEVQAFENYLDILTSIHKECGDTLNWEKINAAEQPSEPVRSDARERAAEKALDQFKPGMLRRAVKRVESKRAELAEKIDLARSQDDEEYQNAIEQHAQDLKDWQEAQELSARILAGDRVAMLNVISEEGPFSEISELGSSIAFAIHDNGCVVSTLAVNSEDVIPKEAKSQLKSGKLSTKPMPKGKFIELYQDYVCGCVLRVARELFALLPVDRVIVNATANLVNTKTGHLEDQPILSVAIPRATLHTLNFHLLDPSDSMTNFIHRMAFKKTAGFSPVKAIAPAEFPPARRAGAQYLDAGPVGISAETV